MRGLQVKDPSIITQNEKPTDFLMLASGRGIEAHLDVIRRMRPPVWAIDIDLAVRALRTLDTDDDQ